MTLANSITNSILMGFLKLTCKLDLNEFSKIPASGPMIIVANHVSMVEAPLLYLGMRPRRTIAMGKAELWNHFFTRKLMQWWECIPIHRGEADMKALRSCFSVLDSGDFLCIAPEGTRSKQGTLQRGKAGTTLIACRKQVPLIPVAHQGFEHFSSHIKRLKRTPIKLSVGNPFIIHAPNGKISSEQRQLITDEIMRRIAQLLPEYNRGYYKSFMEDPFIYTQDCETIEENNEL